MLRLRTRNGVVVFLKKRKRKEKKTDNQASKHLEEKSRKLACSAVHLMEGYIVTRKIGGGAQGSVFQVSRKDSGQPYALKVIYCVGEQQVNAALKEVKFLLALRHPNVVSYVDFFLRLDAKALQSVLGSQVDSVVLRTPESNALSSLYSAKEGQEQLWSVSTQNHSSSVDQGVEVGVCLIMELCRNGDLQSAIHKMRDQYMETGRHPEREETIITWLSQIAAALKHIHGKGFIHRDVKPLNLFFDVQGNVKLGDFGVAATTRVGCQSAVGTPDYLAPERLLHQVYNEKVDIWGLGMVALEVVTLSNHPINSRVLENPASTEAVVEMVEREGFSVVLGNLIKSMLQRQPDDRPHAAAVLELLRACNSPLGVFPRSEFHQGNGSSLKPLLCSICEVETGIVTCEDCNNTFCFSCNTAKHKHPSRSGHRRSTIIFSSLSSENSSSTGFQQPFFSSARGAEVGMQSSSNSHAIRVPDDYRSLSAALQVAAVNGVHVIYVSSGYICQESLELSYSMSSIAIVGESPPPVINVDDNPVTVHLASGTGSLSNFVIRNSWKRECLMEGSKGGQKNAAKPPRPTAFCVSGGKWEIHNCIISCQQGSGMLISESLGHNVGQEELQSNASLVVKGCTFSGLTVAGIIFSPSAGGVIKNNIFQHCGYAALVLNNGAHPHVFDNCIVHGGQMGIICENANGVFERNDISHNADSGVLLKGSREASTFSKNIIAENRVGVLAAQNAQSTVCENNIVRSKKAGVVVKGKACPIIKENTIASGEGAGVYILDQGAGYILGNDIHENGSAGILVKSKGNPQVIGNRIENNLEGIWLLNEGGGSFLKNEFSANQNGSKVAQKTSHVVWLGNIE